MTGGGDFVAAVDDAESVSRDPIAPRAKLLDAAAPRIAVLEEPHWGEQVGWSLFHALDDRAVCGDVGRSRACASCAPVRHPFRRF